MLDCNLPALIVVMNQMKPGSILAARFLNTHSSNILPCIYACVYFIFFCCGKVCVDKRCILIK
jgi:hypothetical protein